jgi:hypothetical protein
MKRVALFSLLIGIVACPRDESVTTTKKTTVDETVPARTMPETTPSAPTSALADREARAALDRALVMLITDQMLLYEDLRPVVSVMTIAVKDGTATLGGSATEAQQKQLIDVTQNVRGIRRVENRLSVAPTTPMPSE